MQAYKVNAGCLPVELLVMGPIDNNVYIIGDEAATMVVDPSCEPDRILAALKGRALSAIVLTHRHWDHVGAARALRDATGALVVATQIDGAAVSDPEAHALPGKSFEPCPVDHVVSHGDILTVGNMAWRVIATPGHTPGGMCLFIDPRFGTNPEGAPLLVSGDTLFAGAIGRTDFEGGSMEDMRMSLKRLAVLPDNTIVLPGHNDLTTIGAERQRVFARYAPRPDEQ